MRWRRILAFALVMLFLGMMVSSASVAAAVISPDPRGPDNIVINAPAYAHPEIEPGDEIQPQFWQYVIIIGLIVLDWVAHWFLEHFISPDVAAVYDAVSMLIEPGKVAEKLGIKGVELGIKVISDDKVLIGLFKDSKVVKEITYASKGAAEWVSDKLGKDYITKIVEKYVVKDGGLRKGEEFDEVAGALKRMYEMGITNGNARRFIVDRGWNVKKLEKVLEDVENVPGGKELIGKINRDLRKRRDLGPLYEAEVVSHLKQRGWKIEEVEHDFKLRGDPGDIDIIAWQNGERVYIECKRSTRKISPGQLLKEAEYANMNGVKKLVVYYFRDNIEHIQKYRDIEEAVKEAKMKYGVEISIEYQGSEFT